MKKILVAALALSAATSYADTNSFEGFYVGGGISKVRNDSDNATWRPVEIFGGYKLNAFVGGEIRAGTSYNGYTKLTNYESVYYRTESTNSVGKTYLLLGYTHVDISAPAGDYNFNGFSYGAGVGFVISDHFNLNLEYKVLADAKGTKYTDRYSRIEDIEVQLNSVSATVDYRF